MLSRDTGLSSKTMAAIALGADNFALHNLRGDAPYDPSDFGRCYRLVKAVPAVRSHFDRIGELVPQFRGILLQWDELCAIYERDLTRGRSDDLYRRITELRDDRPNHPVLRTKKFINKDFQP
jgi:hypothetical protein